MYSVRLYKSTGFNADNFPDSENLLNQYSYEDVPAIDTLQDRFLTSIRVKTTWDSVKNCDYCRVSSGTDRFFYSVRPIRMTSTDTAELSLLPDFLLSAGGVSSLKFTDGVTERVCVDVADDVFGAYTEDDPLTQPVKPLKMVQSDIYPWTGNTSNRNKHYTFVESTVNLHVFEEDPALAVDYIVPTGMPGAGDKVTVPFMDDIPFATDHLYGGKRGTCTFRLDGLGSDETGESPQITDGMKRARGLGMDNAIISQYKVPYVFVSTSSPVTELDTETRGYTRLGGMTREYDSGIPYTMPGTYKNKRISYGEYTKYGIITCAGNRAEYRAEDIIEDDEEEVPENPTISVHPDVRSDGRPFWRFRMINHSGANFWQNCLAGADWQSVPLVWSEKSGSELYRMQFEADRKMQSHAYAWGQAWNAANTAKSAFGAFSGVQQGDYTVASTFAQGRAHYGSIAGGLSAVGSAFAPQFIEAGLAVGEGAVRGLALADMYHQHGITQTLNYLASNVVVAPEIQIPYNTNIMREMYDNGCVVYRYVYDDYDIARVDKLLTMYGYKITKALESTDFTNRPKFNYVQAHGVSVTASGNTSLPKWMADGCAAQLEGGVRIWHVKPDVSIYDSGNVTGG